MSTLSESFLKNYPEFPGHMNPLGQFVYYRTYSRWLPELQRRETWKETCARAIQYNGSLQNAPASEVEAYFDNMFNLGEFLSGRTQWVGGTAIVDKAKGGYNMSNFNCAGTVIRSFDDFIDAFYLLMLGTGVGARILKTDIMNLAQIRQYIKLTNMEYVPLPKGKRIEGESTLSLKGSSAVEITIADSKEGWVTALKWYFVVLTDRGFKHINEIRINYNNIRPQGSRLETFGGTASGGQSMVTMISKIHDVLMTDKYAPKPANGWLRPIHALDILTIIGQNVVVGGVRRTACILLLDPNDVETVEAKLHIVKGFNDHRYMSNNSIFYQEKPTREQLHRHFEVMRANGEPGFLNAYAARLRKPDFEVVNPCCEVLLRAKQLCNLVTTNCMRFVKDGVLDLAGLVAAHKLNARAAVRMSTVELELAEWDKVNKEDPLTGISLLGWFDMLDAVGLSEDDGDALLVLLREEAHKEVEEYCKALGIKVPKLVCTIKPEGTISKVAGGVSPGAGRSRAPWYIRRIRINAADPLCKTVEALGWRVYNENGQGINDPKTGEYIPVSTKVIEFPVKSTAKTTTLDVTALQQLNTYYRFQENYTDHNTSITIDVNPDEWEAVEQNIWDNWDRFVGVSFLERFNTFYDLMPEEPCSEAEYELRKSEMIPFDPEMLTLYEKMLDTAGQDFELAADEACANGVCPIR